MKEFFAFRLMITAGLIKVLYPLGAIGIIIGMFFVVPKQGGDHAAVPTMGWDRALLVVIFANIGWRIFCEQMIVLFSIHESLTRPGARNGKG